MGNFADAYELTPRKATDTKIDHIIRIRGILHNLSMGAGISYPDLYASHVLSRLTTRGLIDLTNVLYKLAQHEGVI